MRAAQIACEGDGVHAMHDPTEGGLATGLHELGMAADIGLEIWESAIPVAAEGRLFCELLGLDPLGVIASGALIVAVDAAETEALVARLSAEGLPASVIGRAVPASQGRWLVKDNERVPLPIFERDEIARLFE